MVRHFAGVVAIAALVIAGPGCGGGAQKKPDDGPPKEAAPATPPAEAGPRTIHHEQLREIENQIDAALGASADAANAPDFAAASAGAEKVKTGADDILKDAPATIKDEDRLRYEGLVAQLKERADGLAQASAAKDRMKASRSFQQLTASCVKCHTQFGPPQEGK